MQKIFLFLGTYCNDTGFDTPSHNYYKNDKKMTLNNKLIENYNTIMNKQHWYFLKIVHRKYYIYIILYIDL